MTGEPALNEARSGLVAGSLANSAMTEILPSTLSSGILSKR